MYIIIPVTLIAASIIGIGLIVWRKLSFLRKLTPNQGGKDVPLLELYFPEIKNKYEKVDISGFKQLWLSETEKMLRRLRTMSLKIDRISDTMIKKVRHAHTQEQSKAIEAQERIVEESQPIIEEIFNRADMLKREEQGLIVEIAKNPKEAALYLALGDIYTELEQFEDAMSSYETCVKLDADNATYKKKVEEAGKMVVDRSK